jgi:hypothetical protein
MGYRCADDAYGGGEGNVMFDDIRVLASTCVPAEGPVADFDNNCVVNWQDLDFMANDWLEADVTYDWTATQQAPHKAPILWYDFNETAGEFVTDSGTGDANNYTGTVIRYTPLNWDTDGSRNGTGCLYLPGEMQCYVNAATNGNPLWWLESSSTQSISVSVWINADLTATQTVNFGNWPGLWGVWGGAPEVEWVEVHCPTPWPPTFSGGPGCNFIKLTPGSGALLGTGTRNFTDFSGPWNNWVFIHDRSNPPEGATAEMRTYLNGVQIAEMNNLDDADVAGPLCNAAISALRVGTRGDNWCMWAGKMDDFQVYDYALDINEIHFIASDGSGVKQLPLLSEANIKSSSPQIVNFGDLALMVDEWMTEKLWP